MPRVSSYASNQNILTQILRAQNDMFKAQSEVASGKKATNLREHGRNAETVAATLATRDRYQNYYDTGDLLRSQLETQSLAIEEIAVGGDELLESIRNALANGTGIGFMNNVKAAFDKVVGALNLNYAGKYIFSGARTDVPPVTITTLDELAGLTSSDDAFQNDTQRASTRIDDGVSLVHGMVAREDIAGELFSAFKTLKEYADLNGNLTGNLTEQQRSDLQSQIAAISSAMDGIRNVQALSNQSVTRVEQAQTLQDNRLLTLNSLLSDMTDADMAEAATRLQLSQTAIQGAAQVFNTLRQTSLLNFLQ